MALELESPQVGETRMTDTADEEIETVVEEKKGKVVEINRVEQAALHFNEQDPQARWLKGWFRRQLIQVGRAEGEALELLTNGLVVTKDDRGKITRAELLIPAASPEDEMTARLLLDPNRPKDLEKEEKKRKKREAGKPSSRQLAAPVFRNAYRLDRMVSLENDPALLVFVLLATYQYVADRGPLAGQKLTAMTVLPAKFLQRLITRFRRPPLFDDLPPILKNGAAQEAAQAILSSLGLEGQSNQPSVGLPSMIDTDPRLAQARGRRVKVQPALFVNSTDVTVHLRRWQAAGRQRSSLYAAIPLVPDGGRLINIPQRDGRHKPVVVNWFWWRDCLDQFTPLPAFGQRLRKRQRILLVPLSIQGGRRRLKRLGDDLTASGHGRFVRALSGRNDVCWSRLVYRGGEFILQITVERSVQPIARPNLLGVHIVQVQVEGNLCTCLFWTLLLLDGKYSPRSDFIEVDHLSIGSRFPSRNERRNSAYSAARKIVALADEFDADLAVEEVVGVRKRGRGCGLRNRLAARFNFSDLAQFIADKAMDHPRPVTVWRVPGFEILERRKQGGSPRQLAELVTSEGWQIRRRVLNRLASA